MIFAEAHPIEARMLNSTTEDLSKCKYIGNGCEGLPILTPHHPNQNLDSTICRRPNAGPNVEKKQTVNVESKLKKRITRTPSTKPMLKSALPKTPIVNDGMTIFAASHCGRHEEKLLEEKRN